MTTIVESISRLVVGTVESVASNEIRVLIDFDAPQSTALNTGTPSSFPRLNGYVLIPNEAGSTVGYITWIGIERSPYPKRTGYKDFGLIDLPFPLRQMVVTPVGTLTIQRSDPLTVPSFELRRGVVAFPSVGDQVLLPTLDQIAAIVGARDSDKRVRIGVSPMANNAVINVDPDKIFGRHLAVLGNTGSGKSCTVAGLIRWSLEAADNVRVNGSRGTGPNARFIILDPNGEYAEAFKDMPNKYRVFRVPPVTGSMLPLEIPAWMWNGHEWGSVAQAQPAVQRPLLMQSLRNLRANQILKMPRDVQICRYLISYSARIAGMLNQGTDAFAGRHTARFECARILENIATDTESFVSGLTNTDASNDIKSIAGMCRVVVNARRSGSSYYNDFAVSDLEPIKDAIDALVAKLPHDSIENVVSEDSPIPFKVSDLASHMECIAIEQGGNVSSFIATLGMRIKNMLADRRLGPIIEQDIPPTFESWLTNYIGGNRADNGPIAILDLSLVPSDVSHIVVAVLGRIIFEATQRYRRQHPQGKTLPTVLVVEEAHTFVRRGRDEGDADSSPIHLCREAFERIAREGRKFGLGLVLSSQRPSELSSTILAQCNTFLLHRIVNDRDQDLVSRLVPDNLGGILCELPSLPSGQAILLGWATPIPVLVEIDKLPKNQCPQSSDPDFWDVWTGESERDVDWAAIAKVWEK